MTHENNFGLASLVFAVLSLSIAILSPLAGLILAILGLIFGIIQHQKYETNNWSLWGMILSILGLIINVGLFIYVFKYIVPQLLEAAA